ncbi:MAG: GNAT family N-acetyltransferase [Bdellovibrionales bacterium]|nr:GNAT family N-acetyltransferase [Bdellovibrionales bacterium]
MQIHQANSAEEIERDRKTAEAWGEHLTLEGYLQRESTLRETEFGGGKRTWLATVSEVPGEVVCSCESYETVSWFGGKKVQSLGLASVYTEPKFRGKGYASRMLALVADQLKKTYPNAFAWTGYSEVGAAIYQRVGFQIPKTFEWKAQYPRKNPSIDPEVRLYTQVEILEETYAGKRNWFTPGKPVESGEWDAVGFDGRQAIWIWGREEIYRAAKGRKAAPAHGALIQGSSGFSGLMWTLNHKADELWILNAFSTSEKKSAQSEMKKLIHAAIGSTQNLGLNTAILWNESAFSDFDFLESETEMAWKKAPNTDSIPIVYPLKAGVTAEKIRVVPFGAWL